MTTQASTPTGEANNHANDAAEFDAAEAFFKNLTGDTGEATASTPEKPAEGTTEAASTPEETAAAATPEEAPEGTQADPATQTPEKTETTAQERRQAADEDDVVVQVGEESLRVSVKDLKRLYGQEASLTRKSQEVAAQKQAVAAEAEKYAAGLDRMAKSASDKWAEYQKIDYLLAKDAMEPAQFAQLRADAQQAFQTHQFYQGEIQQFSQVQRQRQAEAFQAAVTATKTTLADPASPHHIPNFTDATHNELVSFATTDLGAPEHLVRMITEPWALKAIHLAAQQVKAAKTASAVPVVTRAKPVVKATQGTPVGSSEAPAGRQDNAKANTAMARLRQSGDIDDAANAFLAGWGVEK